MSGVTFFEFEQALAASGCGADAAQAHATLTGLICAGPDLPDDWVAQVTGGGDDAGCRQVLDRLLSQTGAELRNGDMGFDLLLPPDSEPLSVRAEALAQWCQGFLVGLTVGGIEMGKPLPGDVGEVISDFSDVSQAVHAGEAEEQDEEAYVELCEFVRVGTQLVYEELQARRGQA